VITFPLILPLFWSMLVPSPPMVGSCKHNSGRPLAMGRCGRCAIPDLSRPALVVCQVGGDDRRTRVW
jgi:hypothetical protein